MWNPFKRKTEKAEEPPRLDTRWQINGWRPLNRDYKKWDSDSGLKETVDFNGKAIEIRRERLIQSRHACHGDHLILEANLPDGDGNLGRSTREFPIDRSIRIDEMFMFWIDDDLGYSQAMIGGFGELKKEEVKKMT